EMVRWASIPYSVNESKEHGDLAAEVARKSVVLLKNEGGLLPLKRDLKTIAVIGPNADSRDVLLGNYNGEPAHAVTPLQGIRNKVGPQSQVLYARGADLAPGIPTFEAVPASALYRSATGPARGLAAQYFGTANFNGRAYIGSAFVSEAMRKRAHVPVNPQPVFTRTDPQVDFDWNDGAPPSGINDDDFGVRWDGYLEAPVSGKYELGAIGMTAFELYLDGKRIVETDNVHERQYRYDTVELHAGKRYAIRLDFHETIGDANIQLVWAPPRASDEPAALDAARRADVVLMFLGLSPRLEGEEMKVEVEGFRGGDRVKLGIPRVQEELLQRVTALGKPVVLVLLNGSAVAVNWAREHVPAIVELWYPGQAGGTALADVLFGDYNPAGRLPVTFYQSETQLPPFEDYDMKGRTYRYFEGEPLFPFGYGLSYTTFTYRDLRVPQEVAAGRSLKVSVEVENTGARAGEEVVQLYVTHAGVAGAPIRSLEGFRRIALAPREKKTVEFTLAPRQLARVRAGQGWVVEPGTLRIAAGGKQPGFTGPLDAATTGVVTGEVQVTGPAAPVN
ncbi:MAG TPA: glycoside hydrolase family 3 C-terminal domain-containing protein, partial [Bryobacteraceae bacterium]|nr:glycoside hydrolase family 3 C-terminal domain-containing protein [Bryobacteraceae bacterium]